MTSSPTTTPKVTLATLALWGFRPRKHSFFMYLFFTFRAILFHMDKYFAHMDVCAHVCA